MKPMFLRDVRHLDKFLYMFDGDLFYEPVEVYYKPLEEYITLVTDLLRDSGSDWMAARDGFWFHVHPSRLDLAVQGWKVHLSATTRNGASILKRAARIALLNNVPFKFALDRNVLSTMSSKRWHRGGSGKFITMYPPDLPCFKTLLELLYAELREEEGPYILSDKRYKDCRVLYYRFGGMARNTRLDVTGLQIPVLIPPDGEAVRDLRTPFFAPPTWATDPFPSQKPEERELTLNSGRYVVKNALVFSNSGGVYLAEDRNTGMKVVIKEARPFTVVDDVGNDAIKRLQKEYEILELLKDTGITPKPLEVFSDWENFFLVEEFIEGIDVRDLMLTQSPVVRANPTLEETTQYYDIFKKIFINLARALHRIHELGIVFGDLSPVNIKVDVSTCAVRIIDCEVAFRPGVDDPTYLFTPGFRNALSAHYDTQSFDDDLYSLAAVMLYALFPIAAFSSLRDDLFDAVLKVILADIGWSETEVFNTVNGLSKGEVTCNRACELLDRPVQILPPRFNDEIGRGSCENIIEELARFVLGTMRTEGQGSLFPADPFMYQTNLLSLGFGACGVLYTLKKCGFEVPSSAYDWLEKELDGIKAENMPPGLFTGSSGIAWSLWELGFEDRAVELMRMANQSKLLKRHHSYLYGMAGVGLANLFLYVKTRKAEYLATSTDLAESLLRTAKESERGIYWEPDNLIQVGFGYGQTGVALFFLRLFQISGKERFLSEGRRALQFDLSHGVENEKGVLSFPRGPSDTLIEPYLEEGTAGIARTAIRYGICDRMEMILADVHRKYAVFPSFFYGIASFVDVLTDAFLFSNDEKYLKMARRPIAGIRDIYLIKQSDGLATPGDGLFKISCDYATGVAGVLRTLYRFVHLDEADFVLDGVAAAAPDQLASSDDVRVCSATLSDRRERSERMV